MGLRVIVLVKGVLSSLGETEVPGTKSLMNDQ